MMRKENKTHIHRVYFLLVLIAAVSYHNIGSLNLINLYSYSSQGQKSKRGLG